MSPAQPLARRRVLVIDDNESIHNDFRKILAPPVQASGLQAAKAALFGGNRVAPAVQRPTFAIDGALQGQQGAAMVRAALEAGDPYQVAFVDMRMPPGWDGIVTIQHLWQVDAHLQVVICTAHADYSLDQIAEQFGCNDRLLILKKPFDNMEILQLAAALSEKWVAERDAALKVEQLEHMVQVRTAEIEHAVLHDKLTGLPNRTLLLTRLEACLERHSRHPERRFALLFLDFDRFKLINDSLGHEVGDLLLIEIAARLQSALRGTDVVSQGSTPARLGGDEFLVLLEDLQEEHDAARIAQRLLSLLAEPYEFDGQKLHVTSSIGIATSDRGYTRAGDMIRDADTAMYRAKAAGRARYVMFDRVMHDEVIARLALETALRQAVRDDSLDLHYQPIIHLGQARLSGFEALVRWSHPEHGPISATQLIAVAEDTGLIQPLSLGVLRKACRQLRAWQDAETGDGGAQLMMSVNLSRKQLIDPELVDKIERILGETGVAPRSLVLEITESTILDDAEAAVAIFQRLQAMGIWLHLDDFGTGYSSLNCLYQLPLSGLKIDRTFLREVCQRTEHAVVLEAVVRIARAFNLHVIAEGVETPEQYRLLRGLGIDYAQGYLFGRPAPAEQAGEILQRKLELVGVS